MTDPGEQRGIGSIVFQDAMAERMGGARRWRSADYLGLIIETVSRVFSELRRRGVVTIDRQDQILVNDICGVCKLTGAVAA